MSLGLAPTPYAAAAARALHAAGRHVICYVDAGTWESFRPDAGAFPTSVLGRGNGWPGRAHLLGLAVFEKSDPEQARRLGPYFDGVLDERRPLQHRSQRLEIRALLVLSPSRRGRLAQLAPVTSRPGATAARRTAR